MLQLDVIGARPIIKRALGSVQHKARHQLLQRQPLTAWVRCDYRSHSLRCLVTVGYNALLGEPLAKLLMEQPCVHSERGCRSENREREEDSEGDDHVGLSTLENSCEGEHCARRPSPMHKRRC